MKTWKQLHQMAKRKGLKLDHRSRNFVAIDRATEEVVVMNSFAINRDAILRAMTEAALRELQ